MIEFPKIETLYDRDEKTHKIIVGQLRCAEFGNIRRWVVTEKIDGCNVRVRLSPDNTVFYGGRTDNAQMQVVLLDFLKNTLPVEKLRSAFETSTDAEVVLYGEGYGEKIQNGGAYRSGVSLRLFDVLVGKWWLEPDAISDVASKLGILTVPAVADASELPESPEDLVALLGNAGNSTVSMEDGGSGIRAEGVVARPVPMLFDRKGHRVVWKLKFKDF